MNEELFEEYTDSPHAAEGIAQHPESPMHEIPAPETPAQEPAAPVIEMPAGASADIPAAAPVSRAASLEADSRTLAPLFSRDDAQQFRSRWNVIQGKFVDEPCDALQQADALVTEVIEQVSRLFASELSSLESQWKLGNDVSTEDLRVALQHYRSFFNRLVG